MAEQTLELRILGGLKHEAMGATTNGYAASEAGDHGRLVEGSHLSARQTLAKLNIPRKHSTVGPSVPAAWSGWAEGPIPEAKARLEPLSLTQSGPRSSSWL